MANICTIEKGKAARVNGQINEIKQSRPMGGSIHFVFFNLAVIGRNIWQILLLSWSFEKKKKKLN